jgi:hypothetical protein
LASFWETLPALLAQTWPARMAGDIGSAMMAPGHAYQSQEPISTEQMIKPSADLAGVVTFSGAGGAIPGQAGPVLGMGMTKPRKADEMLTGELLHP